MKKEIEDILRADCSDNVMKMTGALADGNFDRFDVFYERYQSDLEMLKRRDAVIPLQMDRVVSQMYALRYKK